MSETQKIEEPLPLGPEQVKALLGWTLKDEAFFLYCRSRLLSSMLPNPTSQLMWSNILEFYEEMSARPTPQELGEYVYKGSGETQMVVNKMRTEIGLCMEATEAFSLPMLKKDLGLFIGMGVTGNALASACSSFNKIRTGHAKLSQVIEKLEDDLERSKSALRNSDRRKLADWRQMTEMLVQMESDYGDCLTTGLPAFDRLILPENEGKGALLPGLNTLLLAGTNAGKTTLAMTIAVANLRVGKSVLYIAHEGTLQGLQSKFMMCLLRRTSGWLRATAEAAAKMSVGGLLTEQELENVALYKQGFKFLHGHLTLALLNDVREDTFGAVCDNILCWNKERRNVRGEGYHLVVEDYPEVLTQNDEGLLKDPGAKVIVLHRYHSTLFRMAEAEGFHILTLAQTTREGSRANKGNQKGIQNRLLITEDVGSSYGICQSAATVITINRSQDYEDLNLVALGVAKSRTGGKGAIVARSDYQTATVYREDWPNFSLPGSVLPSASSALGTMLLYQNGQDVPADVKIEPAK